MSENQASQESHEPVFKGVWIPAEIWDSGLTPNQMILWATISSLGKKDKPCIASNDWLAKRFGVSPQVMANYLAVLRKKGFIKDLGFDGRRRAMLAINPTDEGEGCLNQKGEGCLNQIDDKVAAPLVQERKEENKDHSAGADKVDPPLPDNLKTDTFAEAWKEWNTHRSQKKQKLTPVAKSRLLLKLSNIGPERAVAAIYHSIENGWTGCFEPTQNDTPRNAEPPLWAQLKAIQHRIDWHPANRNSVRHDPNATPEQREDLKQLVKKRNELRASQQS